jgi:hypothetical protein
MLVSAKGKNASAALAQRAVFELAAEVREAAVKALKDRPRDEYRPVLLEALQYPWAPVADHAAEALVALNDYESVYPLAALLDKPDPRTPIQDQDKKWRAPELVRINHMGNCILCHAPSPSDKDPMRGLMPQRGKSLQDTICDNSATYVRADVTILKQDFSALQYVADPGKWPNYQRFDYLIRKRELHPDEVACVEPVKPSCWLEPSVSYPQREAVLWALRELTGANVGDRTGDWYQFLWSYMQSPTNQEVQRGEAKLGTP